MFRTKVSIGVPASLMALLLASSMSGWAEPNSATQHRSIASQQAQAEDPKICKRVVPTGSRIARRYCLSKSEWDAMREDGQKAARDAFALESQYGYDGSPSGS